MRLILEGESSARMEMGGEGFEVESEGHPISPYHLLAGSLMSCTVLTLESWATMAKINIAPLVIRLSWRKVEEQPARIESMAMELRWPGLPEARVNTADRVADLCPIHATLERAVDVSRRIVPLPESG